MVLVKSFSQFVFLLIIYVKKFLDCDWPREMQFFGNTVQKRVKNVTF